MDYTKILMGMILALCLLSGCVETKTEDGVATTLPIVTTTVKLTSLSTTSKISTSYSSTTLMSLDYSKLLLKRFTTYNNGKELIIYFYVTDQTEMEFPVEGDLDLTIFDKDNTILYHSMGKARKESYISSTIGLLSKQEYLLFHLSIPLEEITKSEYDKGTTRLIFTLPDKSYFNVTDYDTKIPQLSEGDIIKLVEERYTKSATKIDQIDTRNKFIVTVIRVGYYTHRKYTTWGDEVTDFRVDLRVKNDANEKRYFRSSNALILFSGKQYQANSFLGGTFKGGSMYQGVTSEGYILFEDIPDIRGKTFDLLAGTSNDEKYKEVEHKFNNLRVE